MDPISKEVFEMLSSMGIGYRYLTHPAAATMTDCKAVEEAFGAVMPKNIFLTPRNGSAYWLLITRPNARYKTSDISKQLGSARLSFAPADKLFEYMKCTPGAITPIGLLFDVDKKVKLAVDSALREEETLIFHPCVNTMSVAISGRDFFEVFLPALGYEPVFVEIHDFLNDEDTE